MKNKISLLPGYGIPRRYVGVIVSVLLLAVAGCSSKKPAPEETRAAESDRDTATNQSNTLTDAEKKEGWTLLFDGQTTEGWRGAYKEGFPEKGWKVENGLLKVVSSGGGEADYGGDIITENQYSNFEFSLEFKLSEGANSGIKYFVKETYPEPEGSAIGLEYQLIDDSRPDVDAEGTWSLASVYELYPAKHKDAKPIGEFNKARILAHGDHVEHWLNGKKVVEYTRGSEKYRNRVAKSKYSDRENFGEAAEGHILLQDHGHEVAFRNIKIRELNPEKGS